MTTVDAIDAESAPPADRSVAGPGAVPGGPAGSVAHGAPLPWPVAVACSVVGGAVLLAAFPPYDLWWLAPVGVAASAAAAHRRRLRAGFGLGALTGLVLFGPLLAWTNLHTGYLPWLLLSGLQAAYLGLLGAASAWVAMSPSGVPAAINRPWSMMATSAPRAVTSGK